MLWLDDPGSVPKGMTRYHVGIVLHEGSFWDNLGETLSTKGYKIATLPASARAGAAIFPFTGMLSILLAVPFVYGRLGKYAEKAGLAEDSCGSPDGQQVLGLYPNPFPHKSPTSCCSFSSAHCRLSRLLRLFPRRLLSWGRFCGCTSSLHSIL
jgi:hypothetical protein